MNKDFYNELQFLYVSLTERFSKYSDYTYDGFYKCYNEKYFFLRDKKKEFLEKLSKLKINDIYSEDYKNEKILSQTYLDSNLIKFCANRVCIIDGLGQIILYYILYLIRNELDDFIKYVELTKNTPNGFITSNDNKIYFAYTDHFEEWVKPFEENTNKELLIHLFTKTNSNIIFINSNGKIEISGSKIKDMQEQLKNFDFTIL